MSREVRRVPLTFDWPLRQVWQGYLMPERLREDPCPDCERGYTAAAEWLHTVAGRLGMVAEDIGEQRRGRPMHPWLAEDGYPPLNRTHRVARPTEDILDLVAGLTGEDRERPTHWLGSTGGGRIAVKIVKAAGLDPEVWGICPTCQGHGTVEKYPGQRAEADAWEWTEPPEGDGFQLWETVSEGSPISPVFPAPEGLASWMSSPAYTWGAVKTDADRPTYEAALRFIDAGWAPTFVSTPTTGVVSGVEWVGNREDGETR
ncbi:hypothetical protein [Streptomyces synnematoformans]|uniref:Uncharacterized protein n=1 Tax=Streptomyces synnematoformans TaxID=415721 RepID=A0ABP5IYP1_9ACTN